MGIRDAIIITVLLSQSPLSDARGQTLASSLLQRLLSSNPQLLKMAPSNLIQQANAVDYSPYCTQVPVAPILSSGQYLTPTFPNQNAIYSQCPGKVIEMPYSKDYQVYQPVKGYQYQNTASGPVVANAPVVANSVVANAPVVANSVVANAPLQYSAQTPSVQYSTVQQTQQTYQAPGKPCPFLSPAPLVNPFLPAASPVSALCPPTSSLLPPANPSLCRSQFLRKCPIPPPCL